MRNRCVLQAAALAAALGAGGVMAQANAPVMTDVAPLPAEDRASPGAIVLEKSLVKAQRDNAFQRSSAQTGIGTINRGVLRTTSKAQTEADLALARENESIDLYNRGAAGLVKQ